MQIIKPKRLQKGQVKLFLTSAGLTTKKISNLFLKELGKKPEDCKVLMVSAKSPEKEHWVMESKKEIEKLGFQNIKLANINYRVNVKKLGNFDFLYICGGNTFYILKRMRYTGMDKFIKGQVQKGAAYVGVSAGSILAGKSIEVARWGSEGDKNEVNLKDLTGFSFTNIAILPHFHKGIKKEAEDFKKRSRYPVIELTDKQAVFCKNKRCIIL